jgi:hypothetical protein
VALSNGYAAGDCSPQLLLGAASDWLSPTKEDSPNCIDSAASRSIVASYEKL